MSKNAAITVRLPLPLHRRLKVRARLEKRSLSAQVEYELEQSLAVQGPWPPARGQGSFGRYEGARVPTDADFADIRARLSRSVRARWRSVGGKASREAVVGSTRGPRRE
jgi:hypothetical protein